MKDMSVYGDELAQIRKHEKISQKDLSKITGYSQQAISRIEKKAHIPTLKTLTELIEAMGYEIKIVKKNS